jgi:hypothetical protein
MCRLALAFVVSLACVALGCTQAAQSKNGASWSLALRVHVGERIMERSYENDRVDWKLPEHRLARFRAAGVIINEEQHITTTTTAMVVSVLQGTTLFQGSSEIASVDVPRHHSQSSKQPFFAASASNYMPATAQQLQVEDAAMAGLPAHPVALGQQWQTRLVVMTTLGSGETVFTHKVVAVTNGLLEISVIGQGSITGTEYHLPKLLPGTISLSGTAWYDPATTLVTQESYSIHNRIIKPMEGEESGFDEQLSVDTSTREIK